MKLPSEPGIYEGIPFARYQLIDAVNWSTLKLMKKSPRHYLHATKEQAPDTDAMRLGRATHVRALEPERFLRSWMKWDGDRRYGKEWDKFKAKAEENGCEILTEKQWDDSKAIADAAAMDEYAAQYLRGGRAEVTMIWRDPVTGVLCKGRTDFGSEETDSLTDLKSTRDASPDGFARQAWNLEYGGQAAFYRAGRRALTGRLAKYVVVAVETAAPHVVQPYEMPAEMLSAGDDLVQGYLERLVWCRKESRWPGYGEGLMPLTFPQWALPRGDEEDLSDLGIDFTEAAQ